MGSSGILASRGEVLQDMGQTAGENIKVTYSTVRCPCS